MVEVVPWGDGMPWSDDPIWRHLMGRKCRNSCFEARYVLPFLRRWDFKRRAARYGQHNKIPTRIHIWQHQMMFIRHIYFGLGSPLVPVIGHQVDCSASRERTCPPGFECSRPGFYVGISTNLRSETFCLPWPNLNSRFELGGDNGGSCLVGEFSRATTAQGSAVSHHTFVLERPPYLFRAE